MHRFASLTVAASVVVVFGACTVNEVHNPPPNTGAGGGGGGGGGTKTAPAKTGNVVQVTINKGGTGKDPNDIKSGNKAGGKTLGNATAKGKKDTADNDCAGVPDGDAICKGSSISLCEGEQEYFLDCNQMGQDDGWDGGDCYETSTTTDCFYCDQQNDGSTVCCDPDMNDFCCDQTGVCWKP